jgi:hypothetical protein
MTGADLGRSDEVSIDFSTEELVALTDLLGVGLPPGLAEDPPDPATPETTAATIRSLLARHALELVDGEAWPIDPVAQLIRSVTAAGLVARAEHESAVGSSARYFTATPEVTVERVLVTEGVHRLTICSSADFLLRVLAFCGLEDRPVPEVDDIELSAGDLLDCRTHARAGATSEALSILAAASADDVSARAFAAAAGARSRSRVVILHRPKESTFEGGELAWIDGGEHGLWLLPDADAELASQPEGSEDAEPIRSQSVSVQATSAAFIAEELYSYLPS